MRGATRRFLSALTSARFQPTRPLRGATVGFFAVCGVVMTFQPTRPLRGATATSRNSSTAMRISTHAPLAGRDRLPPSRQSLHLDFNPRAPCGARLRRQNQPMRLQRYFNPRAPCGARPVDSDLNEKQTEFQPTRPLRGATNCASDQSSISGNFNPRAPCGARLLVLLLRP